jgi:hypothetical protein
MLCAGLFPNASPQILLRPALLPALATGNLETHPDTFVHQVALGWVDARRVSTISTGGTGERHVARAKVVVLAASS